MQGNYRHTKDVLRHSVVYKKRKKAKNLKMAFFGFLFLCLLIGIIFLIRMPFLTIAEVQVKGLQSANTQDVINEINTQITGDYALVLPKKNVIFYPKSKIKADLLNKFATFADVQIGTVDTNKLEVTIVEKDATAVSCQRDQVIIDKTYENCYFIDANAKVFQPVVGEPDQSLTKFVDFDVNTASSTLSAGVILQLQKFKAELDKRNLITNYIKIVDDKSAEFQIMDNGKIMVSLPVDDDLISILNTVLNTKELSAGVNFEYIDIRFGKKVFFKLRNGSGISLSSLSDKAGTSTSAVFGTSTISGAGAGAFGAGSAGLTGAGTSMHATSGTSSRINSHASTISTLKVTTKSSISGSAILNLVKSTRNGTTSTSTKAIIRKRKK